MTTTKTTTTGQPEDPRDAAPRKGRQPEDHSARHRLAAGHALAPVPLATVMGHTAEAVRQHYQRALDGNAD